MKNRNLISFLLVLLLFQFYGCEVLPYDNEICFHTNKENLEKYFSINEEYEKEYLDKDINREEHIIKDNKTYEFVNNNTEFIYIFESDSDNLVIESVNVTVLKNLNVLKYNESINFSTKNNKDETIKITSIPNSNVYIELLIKDKYDKLSLKQKFSNIKIIQTNENTNLISFFDSFDDNNEIYYTKYSAEKMSPKDIHPIKADKFTKLETRGELINLDKNSTYIIINKVFDYYLSSFEYFIAPKENLEKDIILNENSENYLYLDKNSNKGNYTLNTDNIEGTRLIKLSKKTKDSKITINDKDTLDKDNMYYELKKGQKFQLTVKDKDALIEFLYNLGNETHYNYIETYSQPLVNNITVSFLIKLDFLENYVIKLNSNKNKSFGTSICSKIGKDNYHYYSYTCQSALIFGFSYEETIKKEKIQNIEFKNNEYYTLYINVVKTDPEQLIYLSFYPVNITNFVESNLNSANFTNTELLPNTTYKYNINTTDKYIFDLTIDNKDNKALYTPLYTLDNKSSYNEFHFEIKNDEDVQKNSVYINYHRNWPKDQDVKIRIISHRAENYLIGIYIASGILIAVCLVISIIAIVIIIKKRKDNTDTSDIELLNN